MFIKRRIQLFIGLKSKRNLIFIVNHLIEYEHLKNVDIIERPKLNCNVTYSLANVKDSDNYKSG